VNPPVTNREAIAHLDWDVPIGCTRTNCETPAAHLVQVTPGPATCLHEDWFPCCPSHAVKLATGDGYCSTCNETITLVAIRDL
jgi:hypothetical protein